MSLARRMDGLREKLDHAQAFFTRDIWEARIDRLPALEALRYRSARLLYRAVEGLMLSDTLHMRAAALTYYTVLSLVPLLAFGFALLKGFGVYDALVRDTIMPYALDTFAANPSLRRAISQVLDFVGSTDVTSLGFIGLVTLLWAATRLLHNIEAVLNEIWQAPRARGPIQRFAHYVAIIVVVPICLTAAAVFGTLAQSFAVMQWLRDKLAFGAIEWATTALGPPLFVFAALVFLYRIMPNTKVRAAPVLLGAALGSALWYGALIAHVRFQVGVASFNALYASFAAMPIFLVWMQVSWLSVMVGASVGATHQHERSSTQHRRAAHATPALREALCLSALIEIARAFLAGAPPPGLRELGDELDAPEPLLHDLLQRAAAAGLVVETSSEDEADPHFTLARPPESIRVKDALDALRGSASEGPRALGHERGVDPRAAELLGRFDHELTRSPHNRTLRELTEAAPRAEPAT